MTPPKSPLSTIVKISLAILGGEFFIMLLIREVFHPIFGWHSEIWALLDPILLTIVVSPVLYWLVLKPMKEDQQKLESEKAYSEMIVNSVADGIYAVSADGVCVSINNSALLMLGYQAAEEVIGKDIHELIHHTLPDGSSYPYGKCPLYKSLIEGVSVHVENELFWRKDGTPFPVSYMSRPSTDQQQVAAVVNFMDISERQKAQEKLQITASVFESSQEAIVVTDSNNLIVEVNAAFTEITGYEPEEVIGKNPNILSSGRQESNFYEIMWNAILKDGKWRGEIWNRRKTGEVYPEMLSISAIKDQNGKTLRHLAVFSDITRIKDHESELKHAAHFDSLTKLPNRVMLADRLHQAMHQAIRRNASLAVVFLDLDGFKQVNDIYGHQAGDELLITISNRINNILREGDTLARIGGDEFVALLVDMDLPRDCDPVLARILEAAADPVTIGNYKTSVSASIGVTIFPQDDSDADQLMRHADHAMYIAKQSGKSRVHYYNVAGENRAEANAGIITRLEKALIREEFRVFIQPKVDLNTGEIVGGEALIRWAHPVRGLVPPVEFLPLIEDKDIAIRIGDWVLKNSLRIMKEWHDMGLHLPLSINVFARQLREDDFTEKVLTILGEFPDISPEMIEFEIVESTVIDDISRVTRHISACQAKAVRFALDDFGTGYSSLTYLKQLAVHTLKIDQSFIRDMTTDKGDRAIVSGVIGLARSFENEVVAEGVETIEQALSLRELGCHLAQGFLFSPPIPSEQIPAWIKGYRHNLD